MLWQLLRSSTWLLPGLVLLAFWKATSWAFAHYGCNADSACFAGPINVGVLAGIGWWCMLLWFPLFLAGVVDTGLSIWRVLRKQDVHVPHFTYKQALRLSPGAFLIWVAVAGTGTAATLIATYPERPTTVSGWLLITGPWVPLWLALSWLRERALQSGRSAAPR